MKEISEIKGVLISWKTWKAVSVRSECGRSVV